MVRENSALIFIIMDINKIGEAVKLIKDKQILELTIKELSNDNSNVRIAVQSWSECCGEYTTISTLPLTDSIIQIFKDELERVNEEIKSL